ncbi:urease accessory protein UreD [Metallosphaera javensis (ex Sakai et al. 2022)]|uniref:urease accessory protein UreD n=1 Tax=Metallosphaera javensis (ex Sakai et al. 2022) TaxID=2775498 RepID=UPI00258C45AD
MRGYLGIRDNGDGLIIEREGALNAILTQNLLILVNPSEVLANDDELEYNIEVSRRTITDQAFTKVLSDSNVKIKSRVRLLNSNYLIHPVVFYNRANALMESDFYVEGSATIVETFIPGRRGKGERFLEGNVKSVTRVYIGDKLMIYDVFRMRDGDYLDPWVMGDSCLLTTYHVKEGDFSFSREILPFTKVHQRWSDLTNIWF